MRSEDNVDNSDKTENHAVTDGRSDGLLENRSVGAGAVQRARNRNKNAFTSMTDIPWPGAQPKAGSGRGFCLTDGDQVIASATTASKHTQCDRNDVKGHAYENLLGKRFEHDPIIQAMFNKDVARIHGSAKLSSDLDYYIRPGTGLRETLAELYALEHGDGIGSDDRKTDQNLMHEFVDISGYIKKNGF